MYDLIVRFTYKEWSKANPSVSDFKTVDYQIAKSNVYKAEKETTLSISSTNYVNYLKSQIPIDDSKLRQTVSITYSAYGGGAEFRTLLDLSKPNLSIVQKNPTYSNITNGIGIFSSRNFTKQEQDLDAFSEDLLNTELPNFVK
jgi:hypothetical protein